LPGGTLSDDHVVERGNDAYVQSELHVGPKLRLDPGVRFDYYTFHDAAYLPGNSGSGSAAMVNPKMNAAFAFTPHSELYLDFGDSFHSNDVRGTTYVDDPQTHAPFDSTGAPVGQNPLLNRSVGEEIGYRYSAPKLTSTVSLFELYQADELIFDGDHGTTSLGGPTQRKGIELANYFTPRTWLTLDADLATTTARFLSDPTHQGTGVPESLNGVVALGATVNEPQYTTALRMRYFGPRTLDTQGDAKSPPSTVWNFQYTAKLKKSQHLSLDVFNLFNANVPDVTYYYNSWLPYDAKNPANANNPAINPALGANIDGNAGVADYHFHPASLRVVRLTYGLKL
jgi:outer membrane receptor for monomeric catechols